MCGGKNSIQLTLQSIYTQAQNTYGFDIRIAYL